VARQRASTTRIGADAVDRGRTAKVVRVTASVVPAVIAQTSVSGATSAGAEGAAAAAASASVAGVGPDGARAADTECALTVHARTRHGDLNIHPAS
jgi:hypothetical protein